MPSTNRSPKLCRNTVTSWSERHPSTSILVSVSFGMARWAQTAGPCFSRSSFATRPRFALVSASPRRRISSRTRSPILRVASPIDCATATSSSLPEPGIPTVTMSFIVGHVPPAFRWRPAAAAGAAEGAGRSTRRTAGPPLPSPSEVGQRVSCSWRLRPGGPGLVVQPIGLHLEGGALLSLHGRAMLDPAGLVLEVDDLLLELPDAIVQPRD